MKILFFSTYFHPYISGITTYPHTIFNYLAQNNEITVLTFPHKKDLSKTETIDKINVIRMPYALNISKGFISPQSLFYFLKYVKDTDCVILNIPNFEGFLLALIAKLYGKKILSIYHCEVFLTSSPLSRLINIVLNTSVHLQLSLSHKIIAYTKDYAEHTGLTNRYKDKVLYSYPPVEILKIKPMDETELRQEKNGIWIGFAGRTAREKGIEFLIEAIYKLKNKDITLVFAGPFGKDVVGEEDYYEYILSQLKKYSIKYKFLGNLKESQLGAFYKVIDLLVLPSINSTEAFGMVQIDALLLGTPVIASNLPGVRIPVQETKMGIITQPKNSDELSAAINQIITNKSHYTNQILTTNARNIFDIHNIYKFFDRLLHSLQS